MQVVQASTLVALSIFDFPLVATREQLSSYSPMGFTVFETGEIRICKEYNRRDLC